MIMDKPVAWPPISPAKDHHHHQHNHYHNRDASSPCDIPMQACLPAWQNQFPAVLTMQLLTPNALNLRLFQALSVVTNNLYQIPRGTALKGLCKPSRLDPRSASLPNPTSCWGAVKALHLSYHLIWVYSK